MQSLKGHLLVATADLMDPNFYKSVVLMVQHDADGALGLVLNRPTQTPVSDAWEQISDGPCELDGSLYLGGPCQGVLMALHTRPAEAQVEVVAASEAPGGPPAVQFSSEEDAIADLVQGGDEGGPVRLFLGYAGWSPDQLEAELETGSWVTLPANFGHVFDSADEQWSRVQREIALQGIDPRLIPRDPGMN